MDTEPLRPKYHYTPQRNFMNDPCGLTYVNGRFLMFHQFNPFGNAWGHIGWKQAVSPNLVDWTHLPVALAEEDGIMVFSGSAVVDTDNTSGFGTAENPPVVAIYTGHRTEDGMESPCLAYSQDEGLNWHRYEGNPVLPWEKDFRDPKVFRHEESGQWIMLVSKAMEKFVRIYRSEDLRTWHVLSEFGPAGAPAERITNWECPDLFRLPIEGSPGEHRWVLHVGVGDGHPGGGSGGQYLVGNFTGTHFVNDNPSDTVLWSDYGKDNYAAVSWSGITGPQGEVHWVGWMSNWRYAQQVPTYPWRNGLTLPRMLSLRPTAEGLRLVQRPIPHLAALRVEPGFYTSIVLIDNEPVVLQGAAGIALEIEAEFEVGTARECGLAVRMGADERTLIGIDTMTKQVFVDRTHSGRVCSEHFPGRHSAPMGEIDQRIRMHIFVDTASVEVFANEGLTVLTELIFPNPDSTSIAAYSQGGEARVTLKLWNLNPASMSYCDAEATDVE
jgi:fructan beta-fructosidase